VTNYTWNITAVQYLCEDSHYLLKLFLSTRHAWR